MAKVQTAVMMHLIRVWMPEATATVMQCTAEAFLMAAQMEVQHPGDGSVPRVIVTGFSTNPAEVRAGSNFKLTIHLKNTSKMKVSQYVI